MVHMLLSVMQASATALDAESNVETIDAAAAKAAAEGADLLLTPELFPMGYEPLRIRRELDPAVLPSIHASLAAIAANHRIGLVYSLPSVGPDGAWRISSTLLDAEGTVLLDYSKVHLFGDEERAAFSPADAAPGVASIAGVRVSMLICYDAEFPESVRAAALRGAELVLVPTALAGDNLAVTHVLIPARALENHVYVAYANHCGAFSGGRLIGGSVVAAPDGSVAAEAGSSAELLFAEVSPRAVTDARTAVPYLDDRRPEAYGAWGV